MDEAEAFEAWLRLTPDDRTWAGEACEPYAAELKAQTRKPLDAHKWLAFDRHGFRQFPEARRVFVAAGSEQADAHRVWLWLTTKAKLTDDPLGPPADHGGRSGWILTTPWPPLGRGLSAAVFEWRFIEQGTPQWWRWANEIKDLGRVMPHVAPLDAGSAYRSNAILNPQGDPKREIMGFIFPAEWPPGRGKAAP